MVRALTARDGATARRLVHSAYGGTRHVMRTLELLELALAGGDPECVGLASPVGDGSVNGLLLFGTIGGAAGVIKVQALLGATVETMAGLVRGVRSGDWACGARMFVCELSNEPRHALVLSVLASHGFTREARIPDYFAHGMALDVLVLRVGRDQE